MQSIIHQTTSSGVRRSTRLFGPNSNTLLNDSTDKVRCGTYHCCTPTTVAHLPLSHTCCHATHGTVTHLHCDTHGTVTHLVTHLHCVHVCYCDTCTVTHLYSDTHGTVTHLHCDTPSLWHTFTPSLWHTFTPSLWHTFTPSLWHSFTVTLHATVMTHMLLVIN